MSGLWAWWTWTWWIWTWTWWTWQEWYSEVWKIMSPRINTLMFTNFQNIVIFLKNNVKKFPDFFIFNHLQSRILDISYIPLTPEQSLHQYHNIPCNFKPLSACYSKSLLIFPTYAFFTILDDAMIV